VRVRRLVVVGVIVVVALVGGGLAFTALDGDEDDSAACVRVVGPPADRLHDCLDDLDEVSVSEAAAAELRGTVLVAGDGIDGARRVVRLADRRDLQGALLSDDEVAAAAAVRDAGVDTLLVHRDLTNALDRDRSVIARLANHDFLEWFQLRWVTANGLVYDVRNVPLRVDDTIGTQLLTGLRARLSGAPPPPQTWHPKGVRLLGSMRAHGQTLVLRHAVGDDIEPVLDDLAHKMRRTWEREAEVMGLGPLERNLPGLRLEVHIVRERAPVEPRDDKTLFDLWEPGVDGATLTEQATTGERFGYLPGSEATVRRLLLFNEFLGRLADDFDWPDRQPWRRQAVRLTFFRDEHFMEREGGGPAIRLARAHPTVTQNEITDASVRDMLIAGGNWWLRNQLPDGSFVYKYWPDQNRSSEDYNEVRHILAARDLVDTWRRNRDQRYLDAARRAMDWLLQYEVTADDPPDEKLPSPKPGEVLFRYPKRSEGVEPNQKLGTVVVALLGWVEWAQATGSHAEDERIRAMARYTLSQLEKDGTFAPYNVYPGHPYYSQVNDIVPGEAALALGRVAEYFNDRQWIEFFPRFLDHYEPWFRERAAKKQPFGRWPHGTYSSATRLELVQFGPWTVLACRQYFALTGDERAARFGLEIADWVIDNYQWSSDRAPWPDYVGGYYKLPWELPAMQAFVYSEGTAAAYRIAQAFRPERAAKYEAATQQTLRFLRVMQYDQVDSFFAPRPGIVVGAVRYALDDDKIRIDYLGHAMSTMSQYLDARAQP
jgi:hypothetical protein